MNTDASPTNATCLALGATILMFVAACTGPDRQPGETAGSIPTDLTVSNAQVQAEVGEISVSAVALQTSQIPATVAAKHGVERRDDLIMLRISPRLGSNGNVRSAPAQVSATVTDMSGTVTAIGLEKQVTAGLVDQVGTFEATLPANLRFEIHVTTPQGTTGTLNMTAQFRSR